MNEPRTYRRVRNNYNMYKKTTGRQKKMTKIKREKQQFGKTNKKKLKQTKTNNKNSDLQMSEFSMGK